MPDLKPLSEQVIDVDEPEAPGDANALHVPVEGDDRVRGGVTNTHR